MTTLTYPSRTIMAYVGPDSGVVSRSSVTGLPDWYGTKFYVPSTGGTTTRGWRQFDIDPDGDETLQATIGTIGVAGLSVGSGGSAEISYDGTKLFFISEIGNSVRLAEVNASDLSLSAQFGTASSNATPSTSSRILSPFMMTMQNSGGTPKLICSASSNYGEIDALPQSGFASNLNLGDTDEHVGGNLIGPGGGYLGW